MYGSRFIAIDELGTIGYGFKHNPNPKKCRKGVSANGSCLRVFDFATGPFRAEYGDNDTTHSEILSEKIFIARRC